MGEGLRERVRGEVLELAGLVAAVGQTGVAVVPLRPDLDPAAEVLAQPPQRMHRGRPEQQLDAIEVARLIRQTRSHSVLRQVRA